MPVLFIYLLKLSISLAMVYLFYHFVLRRLTFYNWNRWYLLTYTFLSFIIAFTNITPFLQSNSLTEDKTIRLVPLLEQITGSPGTTTITEKTILTQGWNRWEWSLCLVVTGAILLLSRLLIQYLSFLRIRRKAILLSQNGMRLYQVEDTIIPFSFGNSIFVNQSLHSGPELEEIIRHEFVHVKQRHSIDILWTELFCILNWYNPFAWLLRQAVRQNLEFIADNKVVANGIDRKQYQYLLLKVIGNNQFSIAQKFNFSSLKKRIAMMNKLKSTRIHLVKFLFLLPVILLTLVAFRKAGKNLDTGKSRISVQDTLPPSPVKLPATIASINFVGRNSKDAIADPLKEKIGSVVLVKRKDGKKEFYDLKSEESKSEFEKKYGASLENLVPPPPPPPPVKIGDRISVVSDEYDITDKFAWLRLKDGTIEKYDLTDAKQKEAFEKKYGKLGTISMPAEPIGTVAVITDISGHVVVAPVTPTIATTVTGTVPVTAITAEGVSTISPVAVTGVSLGDGSGKGIGVGTASTIAPVTVVSGTGLTATSPFVVEGVQLSKNIVAPVTLANAVKGTTVIAPMNPVATGEEVSVIDEENVIINGKEEILVTITSRTTRLQLDEFKKQLKEKGFDLDFKKVEYNTKGILTYIDGTIDSKSGHSNFVAVDFEKLILSMITDGNRVYFKARVKEKEVI